MRTPARARAATALVAATVAVPLLRSQLLRWGATPQEIAARLPGDDLVADARLTATRAITIDAPADDVWPWVVQLGQGRGGFYSYDALENLVGCDIHSADRVVDAWQDIAVGDEVRLHPGAGLAVADVETGRSLVLRGAVAVTDAPPPYDFTWAFVVHDGPAGTSRLVVRERYGFAQARTALLVEPVAVVSWFMTQRMLRGIRQRAEREARGQRERLEDRRCGHVDTPDPTAGPVSRGSCCPRPSRLRT